MTIKQFLHLPPPSRLNSLDEVSAFIRRMYDALKQMRKGKLECVAELTLTANAATTTFVDVRLSDQTVIIFDPLTANAAAELAAGTLYVLAANRDTGQATITHANNAQTDRSYLVALLG